MSISPIHTPDAPAPSGGYSQGILAGGLLFLSGQGPFDTAGELVDGSIEAQVRQVFANLQAVAEAAGGSLSQTARVGVYLSDLEHFDVMDRVYREVFAEPRPARTTIQSELAGFDVEADAVVLVDR
ncbi:MAG TPA: Rid family hydrolase [Solirubrobacteraceae bacterium]|jgi:reactive intermediate/imine deaminase|nr:Rid family hydrolase [Solirubrobacteraceae bacterium]